MNVVLLSLLALAAPAPEPVLAGRPLDQWIKDLTHEDALVREEAVEVLAAAGPAAREAAAVLEKMTREGPQRLRLRAALALGRIAGKNGPAVELLAQGLRLARTADARIQALAALQPLSADAGPAVPAILEWVDAPELGVRTQALSVLGAIGKAAVPAVLEELEHKEARRRRRAALAVGYLFPLMRDKAPVLRRRLDDEDLAVRALCARALWSLPDTSKPVQKALADAVAHGDPELRRESFATLASILDPVRTPVVRTIAEQAFKDPDLGLRLRAAEVLYRIDGKADAVLPVFLEGLRSTSPALRSRALLGLGALGPKGAPAVPLLIEQLRGTQGYDFELIQAFGRIGAPAAGPLADLLASPKASPEVIQAVTNALSFMGPAVAPKVLPLMDHANPQVRRMACQIVGNSRAAPEKAVPRLIERLADTDAQVRTQALGGLSHFGPAARAAVPKVIPFARDPQPAVRHTCLHTLEAIGADDPAVVPVALAALKDNLVMVRARGLLLLSAANPRHPELVPQALDLIEQQPPNFLGLEVLKRVGTGAAKAAPALAGWLRGESSPATRQNILSTLGSMGPAARAVVPDLIDALRDRDPTCRVAALHALRSIGGADPAKLTPALRAFLRDTLDPVRRGVAFDLLGEQGSAAADTVPDLLQELRKPEGAAHLGAARALGKIAPERARKEGVPLVEKLLGPGINQIFGARVVCLLDPEHPEATHLLRSALRNRNANEWFTRKQAVEAVADLGPAFRDADAELEDVLKDKNPEVRLSAAAAMWRVRRDADVVVPVLLDLLKPAQTLSMRHQALHQLREMGPAAKEARSVLREMRTDPDPSLRQQAAEIVRRLDAAATP
jgi:HEAT repeat protein